MTATLWSREDSEHERSFLMTQITDAKILILSTNAFRKQIRNWNAR